MAGALHSSVFKAGSAEFSLTALLSRFLQKAAAWPLFGRHFGGRIPQKLLYAPFDMHLADPKLAHEFYHGRFPLAGRVVQAGAVSPFLLEPPGAEWEAALHDFGWLCHMAAAETELADAYARALTLDWIEQSGGKPAGRAWAAAIAGRRLSAFLAHGAMLLAGAAPAFQKQFLKSVGRHIRYLDLAFAGEKDDAGRLHIAVSLAMAALVAPAAGKRRAESRLLRAGQRLEAELARQILPDGGHISRNPALLAELLAALIPLHYAYLRCHEAPPPQLTVAIDRMLPALRFFRHADGSLANFNGTGPILPQRLDKVLDADETAGRPVSRAPHSGYQRLASGGTVVLADTGAALAKRLTAGAHAGCLAFELSSGRQLFIVNCGMDPYGPAEFRFFGRLTAAHSTAAIEDTSSCRFAAGSNNPQCGFSGKMLRVETEQMEEEGGQGFIAAHDGYKRAFGLIHERALLLSRSGDALSGCDSFYPPPAASGLSGLRGRLFGKKAEKAAAARVAVRFHIHPDIVVTHLGAEPNSETGAARDTVRLQGRDGETWLFSADCPIRLEDSIYFSGLRGPAKTQQCVLNFAAGRQKRAQWSFRRAPG